MSRAGVDTGGTFTDLVVCDAHGVWRAHKVPSTPGDPGRAILEGIGEASDSWPCEVVHGTTVATNTLLEHQGALCALVTTWGFEDVLILGRQNRPDLYALHPQTLPPLVPSERCFGLRERVLHTGEVAQSLEPQEIARVIGELGAIEGLEAVAICLLHSYINPDHERRVAKALTAALPHLFVSLSSEVAPQIREFERASTTVLNSYVGPRVARYISGLEGELQAHEGFERLELFGSSGARLGAGEAIQHPVQTMLSGPAAGVVGALAVAEELGLRDILTFDMGGTSTDVSLCLGSPTQRAQGEVGGVPVVMPMVDIHTVGAGGGSLAWTSWGGRLQVGPKSAGAVPGPAAYGLGGQEPTVTDAHLWLGRLRAEAFLGGTMALDVEAAASSLRHLAGRLDMEDLDTLALGILEVADAAMVRALKVISVERGHDPRRFALVSFGGAGGLHACRVAQALEMTTVVIPRLPGLVSAMGSLLAPRRQTRVHTVFATGAKEAQEKVSAAIRALPRGGPDTHTQWHLSLRYVGQGASLELPMVSPMGENFEAFHRAHKEFYGWEMPERAVELVALKQEVTSLQQVQPPRFEPRKAVSDSGVWASVGFAGGRMEVPVVAREGLPTRFSGPMVITEYSGTTVVEAGWRGEVRGQGHLVLEVG